MLYRVQSQNGWSTLAINEQEAKGLADAYHLQWWSMGVDMPVSVYCDGDLIYSCAGDPSKPATE